MTDRVDLLERLLDDERLDDLTLGQLRAVVEHIDWLGSQPVFDDEDTGVRPSDLDKRQQAIKMLRSALKFVQKAGVDDDPDPRYVEQWPTVVHRALELTDRFVDEEFEDDPEPDQGPTTAQPGLPDLSGPFRRR